MGLTDTLKVNCRKASELIERRELRPLSITERIGMHFHMRICAACRAYEKQSAIIDQWLDGGRDGAQPMDSNAIQQAVLRRIDPAR